MSGWPSELAKGATGTAGHSGDKAGAFDCSGRCRRLPHMVAEDSQKRARKLLGPSGRPLAFVA